MRCVLSWCAISLLHRKNRVQKLRCDAKSTDPSENKYLLACVSALQNSYYSHPETISCGRYLQVIHYDHYNQ
jgi:hypothetical protein